MPEQGQLDRDRRELPDGGAKAVAVAPARVTGAVAPVVATTAVLTYSAMTALFPAAMAPELASAMGVPAAFIGLQISLVYGGAMATSLVGGTLTDRFGACRASQIALIVLGSGAALACWPALMTFALGSALMGLGYGLTNPAASQLLMRFAPARRRGLIFSIKQTGVPLGGVLAGACAPVLALTVGWQGALALLVVIAAVLAVLLQSRRAIWDEDRDRRAAVMRSPLADLRLVWSARPLRLLSLAGLCFAAVQLCLSAFTVTLLVTEVGMGILQAGLVMAAVQVCGVIGRIVWGWIGDTVGSGAAALLLATSVTIIGALATSIMSPLWPHLVIGVTLCAMGFSALGWNGVYLSEIARLAPADRVARASGGSLFFTFSGVLMGPPAFAGLHLLVGAYLHAFAALAVVSAIGLTLVVMASRRGQT